MFQAICAAQLSLWASIVALGGWQLRRGCEGVDATVLARRLRRSARTKIADALVEAGGALPLLETPARAADQEEAWVLLSERGLQAERGLTRGLPWLRILGMLASFVGLLAVAHQVAWLRADHGLLDLDPHRVGRIAGERAAVALALAVAGSGSAVALGGLARSRVRSALAGLAAMRELLDRAIDRESC
jgi:hypothetical protein